MFVSSNVLTNVFRVTLTCVNLTKTTTKHFGKLLARMKTSSLYYRQFLNDAWVSKLALDACQACHFKKVHIIWTYSVVFQIVAFF